MNQPILKLPCHRTPCSTLALVGALCWTAAVNAAAFEVGFATADITPPAGWRRAGGYSEVVSTGVHDPLFTKAMVLSQGNTTIAFVGNDLTSVPRELTDRARRRASEQTGIPFANIVITATHTHGGPEYYGPLRNFLHARAQQENGGKDPRERSSGPSPPSSRPTGASIRTSSGRWPPKRVAGRERRGETSITRSVSP